MQQGKKDSSSDENGYRENVGIIICNSQYQLLWARRINRTGWQFPQGGVKNNENLEQAVYRELNEEVGLDQSDVKVLGMTTEWLYYEIPKEIRQQKCQQRPNYRGQKQRWFLLQLISSEDSIQLANSKKPEFDAWCWVDYWYPVEEIVAFKKAVYRKALTELENYLPK